MGKPTTSVLLYINTDITNYVRSVSTSRGKSRELDQFNAGQFSIVLDNRNRYFDPTYTDSTTRTNLVKNPIPSTSAAVSPQESWIVISRGTGGAGTTTLTVNGAFDTVTTAASTTGYSFGFTGTTNAQRVQVTAGLTYAISFYATSSVDDVRRLSGTFYNSAGTSLGEVNIGVAQSMTAGVEMRFTGTYTAPANAVSMRVYAAATTGSVIRPLNSTMYWRKAMVEQASTVGTYFSGNDTDTNYQDYAWSGTAQASTSTLVEYANPFFNLIKLRQLVKIQTSLSSQILTGYITDWQLSYDVNGDSIATISGSDAFSYLAQQVLDDAVTVVQKTGERVLFALGRAYVGAFGFSYAGVTQGTVDVVDDPLVAGDNALEYLQNLERSERGSLFVKKDGTLAFLAVNGGSNKSTVLTDDGAGIAYNAITVNYGTDYLFNRVQLENTALEVGEKDNTSSIDTYGATVFSDTGLLVNDLATLQSQAGVLAARYGTPEYRFETVSIELTGLTTSEQNELLGLELTDRLTVEFTPNKTGSQIAKICELIGVNHSISVDRHQIVLQFASADNGLFTLNNTILGRLDYNLLG